MPQIVEGCVKLIEVRFLTFRMNHRAQSYFSDNSALPYLPASAPGE